jgi:hypothetical protein
VTDVGLELAVDNPGGDADNTVVDLKRFHAALGKWPIDGSLLVRSPVSDPDAALRLKDYYRLWPTCRGRSSCRE